MTGQLALFAETVPELTVPGRINVYRADGGALATMATGRRLFADCGACGIVVPAATEGAGHELVVPYRSDQPGGYRADRFWVRCACGEWVRGRAIALRAGRKDPGELRAGRRYCGGACLNGRHSCNCFCRGRCHGAGRCEGH